MQRSCVKVKWLREKNNSLKVKCRCQLVVRLKANKCYQELPCSLSFYINFLNFLNLQAFCSWLQTPGRFQTSSPQSIPLVNFRPYPIPSAILAVIVIVQSIIFQLVLAFAKVAGLAKPSFSITWLVSLDWLIVGLINWLAWLVSQSLVWLVDAFNILLAIIFLSDLRRNYSLE